MAFSDYIAEDFKLFWPAPVRAHTNVALDFRFSYYEKDNRFLTWELLNAPAWMSIDQFGRVTGTPTTPATHSGIQVRLTREGGQQITRTFTCAVNDSDFIFVATTGNDTSGTGSISQPYQTVNKALQSLVSGNGKTIYLRNGTYQDYWTNSSPLAGKNFSEADYTELRAYPGETALIDCNSAGHGPWAFQTSWVVFSKLRVTRADWPERAGLLISEASHCGIKDCVVYDCVWDYSTNPAGIYLGGLDTFCDRCVAYNNGDPAAPNGNSSNFIIYTEGDTANDYIWLLNSKSWGSKYGFKIKHAGPKHLVVHNYESFDKRLGAPTSNYSSVRYAIGYGCGFKMEETEPSRSGGPLMVEHCAVVNAGTLNNEKTSVDIYDPYLVNNAGEYRYNIFYDDRQAAGTGEFDNRLFQFWIYQSTATTDARPKTFDYNLWHSPSQNNIIRSGSSGNKDKSWTAWRTLGQDANGRFGNPNFTNRAGGDLNVASGSNADFGAGVFAGPFVPGRTYGLVGQQNETLLNFDPAEDTGGGPGPNPSFSGTAFFNASSRLLRRNK